LRRDFLPRSANKFAVPECHLVRRNLSGVLNSHVNKLSVNSVLARAKLLHFRHRAARLPAINANPFPGQPKVVKKASIWPNLLNDLDSLFRKQIAAFQKPACRLVYI